jgi:hypothetical protein
VPCASVSQSAPERLAYGGRCRCRRARGFWFTAAARIAAAHAADSSAVELVKPSQPSFARRDVWEFDPRYVTLDGIKALSVKSDGESQVQIVGAFYMLDGTRDRMLPVEARLNVKPSTESTVKLAGGDGTFEMPTSERQFVRRMENVRWVHHLSLHLA